jgi:MOSC domain-containing protein YiiM
MQGHVEAICISERRGTVKTAVSSARLMADHGLQGDAHAGPGDRQISLLAGESIDRVRAQIPDLAHGAFGENLVTRGLDLAALPVGTVLRVGEARLEVTRIGKECHQLCAIGRITGDCIMPREGVFCRVLSGGPVGVGDAVAVQERDAGATAAPGS